MILMKLLRIDRDLTQKQLADKAIVNVKTIMRIEHQECQTVHKDIIESIANALGWRKDPACLLKDIQINYE